jgi:hypothetical protein
VRVGKNESGKTIILRWSNSPMYEQGKTTTFWDFLLLAGERRTSGKRIQGCTQDMAHAVGIQPALV